MTDLESAIRKAAVDSGLSAVGFADATPLLDTRATLVERKAEGLHDGMQFTYRNPTRSTTPTQALGSAVTLIVGARAYAAPERGAVALASDAGATPQASIAAYAWRDHYRDLRAGLEAIAEIVDQHGYQSRVVADDNALVDRAAAARAGLGWFGKNSNLLLPGAGSWFVLGSVITDAPLTPSEPVEPACGPCRRCLDGCPTGAIVAPGVVDAGRCLAWLLQKTGDFPHEYRVALGNRIYGCDDCQEVCPPNRGTSVSLVGDEVTEVDIVDLLSASDEQIERRHGRWYIPQRDMAYVRRNALVALGNEMADRPETIEAARGAIVANLGSTNPMVQRHAGWAAGRSGDAELRGAVEAAASASGDSGADLLSEFAAGSSA